MNEICFHIRHTGTTNPFVNMRKTTRLTWISLFFFLCVCIQGSFAEIGLPFLSH